MEITRDAVEFHGGATCGAARPVATARAGPMTATGDRPRPSPICGAGRVTQLGVIRSEWIKLRSLRSTWFSLLAAVVIIVGLGTLFSCAAGASVRNRRSASTGRSCISTPPRSACAASSWLSWRSACSGCWSSPASTAPGMIRSSLAAVPHRQPVLVAKAVGVRGRRVRADLARASTFVAFLLGQQALASTHEQATLSTPDAMRAILGCAHLPDPDRAAGRRTRIPDPQHRRRYRHPVRHRARAADAGEALPTPYSTDVAKYLPLNAGTQIMATIDRDPNMLGPGPASR